jgi:hypothetical protein
MTCTDAVSLFEIMNTFYSLLLWGSSIKIIDLNLHVHFCLFLHLKFGFFFGFCFITIIHLSWIRPMRIRVRIDPPHPLVCRKRRLNGAILQMRPEKRGPVSQQVWHDKDPSLLKGHLSAEQRPKFCSPSPVQVTSPFKWNILERDVKQ